MISVEQILLTGSILILISILIARFFDNVGIPTLILFIGVGMLAGSEGLGGIYFDDAHLAQSVGITSLVFILFSGGLETNWQNVHPVLGKALSLATIGVMITALSVGLFIYYVFDLPFLQACLIGAIIYSTDAAAVFSVLSSKNVALKGELRPLLELESGSNDPMAVFLTLGFIQAIINPQTSLVSMIGLFVLQMTIGVAAGYLLGRLMILFINRLKISYEGIYPVFALAFACLVYSLTALLQGSGILAVYIAGIVVGNHNFVKKKSLLRFFDGLAWLSQIGMFLTLGLLVFPSELLEIPVMGLAIAFFLMLIARPLSVFISLFRTRLDWRSKAFISWVGLRGAVPIILATFPLLAGVPNSGLFFSLIFFVVLLSALLQGWSLSFSARILRVDKPFMQKAPLPIEFNTTDGTAMDLFDLIVPDKSPVAGKSIIDLRLPKDSLITIINRDGNYIVPGGSTVLLEGDVVLILTDKKNLPLIKDIFG